MYVYYQLKIIDIKGFFGYELCKNGYINFNQFVNRQNLYSDNSTKFS